MYFSAQKTPSRCPEHAQSWYDLACCFDFLGREIEAEPAYQKVFELGPAQLSEKDHVGFYVGFGSTLRNNHKLVESFKILSEGVSKFPNYTALQVFLGFTLYSMGKHQEASAVLFKMAGQLPNNIMDGYERAVKWYSDNLDKV